VATIGIKGEFFDSAGANFTAGCINNSEKSTVVIWVNKQFDITQGVFYLSMGKK
jgi:hypothetical protein